MPLLLSYFRFADVAMLPPPDTLFRAMPAAVGAIHIAAVYAPHFRLLDTPPIFAMPLRVIFRHVIFTRHTLFYNTLRRHHNTRHYAISRYAADIIIFMLPILP